MAVFEKFEHLLIEYAQQVPVEIFAFAGSFIEEVIAPIPSPIVMIVTGSIAQAQEKPLPYILLLAILGALGKTLGASILYFAADKAEDFFLKRFGKFFGISHTDIESIGKHISKSWKDIFILTFIRCLPILPSAPISITCGLLKVRWDVFALATFMGTIIRDSVYLYVGYSGLVAFNSILSGFDSIESVMQGVMVLGIVAFFGFIFHQKRQGKSVDDIKKLFGK